MKTEECAVVREAFPGCNRYAKGEKNMNRVTRLLSALTLAFLLWPNLTVAQQFLFMEPGELLKQIEAKSDVVLLDARSAEEYAKSHIKGALNYTGVEVEGLDLPHSRPIVIYCGCNGEEMSVYLATRLIRNGYKPGNIFVLRGGWYKWLELRYPVDKGNQ